MVAYRIWALMVRYLIILRREISRICDVSVWPIFDILIWGFISVWIARDAVNTQVALVPLFGIFFWQAVFMQASMGISVSILDELFGRNLSSLIASPLKLSEFMSALMLMGLVRMLIVFTCGALALKLFFNTSVFLFGWWLVPLIGLLMFAGWSLGFATSALLIVWGNQAAAFIWATWVLTAFSGVFSPINLLPGWMRTISACLPMSYPLLAAQEYLMTNTISWSTIQHGFAVGIVYYAVTLFLFVSMYKRTLAYGLSRLETE